MRLIQQSVRIAFFTIVFAAVVIVPHWIAYTIVP